MRALLDWLTTLFSPVCAATTTGAPVAVIGYETWCALEPDASATEADTARG